MKSFLFSFYLTVQLFNCNAEVCLPTWSSLPGKYSSNGDLLESVTVLQDCLAQCERNSSCLAVDFSTSKGIVSCGLHYEASDLTGDNFRDGNNVTQYRIMRSCNDFSEACPVKWTLTPNVSSANGQQYNYWTEYDCFTFCRYTPGCVAVDFDNSTSPPCWVHTNPSDLSPANSKYSASSVRYSLNKTCSTPNISQMALGRCAGQWFPSTGWCPPCYEVSIKAATFNVHPLCCYLNADDAQPPGAQWLPSYFVSYFNPTYYHQILSCNGSSDNCTLVSESHSNEVFRNNYCPEKESSTTNFVSISYGCTATRTTCEPSTTNVAKTTPPVLSSTSRSSSSLVPSGGTEKNAPAPMMSTKDNNPLIIGLVVGLGVPLLLAIIIVIIIFAVRRRKQETLKLPSNEKPDAFYYTVGTVPRGNSHENHVDEISMNIDKPVNEF